MKYLHHYNSPLGSITMASDGKALTGLWFGNQRYFADTYDEIFQKADLAIFEQTKRWLDTYFSGHAPDFTPSLLLKITPFRRAVYEILLSIPYGHTITYGEIATIIAKQQGIKQMSAQAVGGAVGHNPVSLIIPCHRVIGADGSLTGYAGGIPLKTKLLQLEKIIC